MVNIPSIKFRSDEEEEEAHPMGIRTLRESGDSVVITIPPDVIDLVDMETGDDLVVHAASETITLTKLPEQE